MKNNKKRKEEKKKLEKEIISYELAILELKKAKEIALIRLQEIIEKESV